MIESDQILELLIENPKRGERQLQQVLEERDRLKTGLEKVERLMHGEDVDKVLGVVQALLWPGIGEG